MNPRIIQRELSGVEVSGSLWLPDINESYLAELKAKLLMASALKCQIRGTNERKGSHSSCASV